jgi:prevent-host-death family protein
MLHVDEIRSLTEFQRNAREHIKRLKRTGRPEVLTVNGEAQVVIQDARSYQKLLERAEEAEQREALRRSVADFRAGRYRDVEAALDELEKRHRGRAKSPRRRRGG